MSFLPVAERELRIRARQPATHRLRVIVISVASLMLLGALVSFQLAPARAGREIFSAFTFLAALFCLYEGTRLTSDSLSEEVREGTMGLLFLTRLGPLDILAGKLASAGLASFYGLVAVFPIASLLLLTGGITGTEVWRTMLALVNLLFFTLAAALMASAWNRDQFHAWAGTGLLIAAVCLGPLAPDAISPVRTSTPQYLSPLFTCMAAASPTGFGRTGDYWRGIFAGQAMGWLFLFIAGVTVKRRWRGPGEASGGASGKIFSRWRGNGRGNRSRTKTAREMLAGDPVQWLASLRMGSRLALWTVALLGLSSLVALRFIFHKADLVGVHLPAVVVTDMVFKLIMAVVAARAFADARREGVFELLVTTPVVRSSIVNGHTGALTNLFAGPVGVWMAGSCCLAWLAMPSDGGLMVAGVTMVVHLVMLVDLAAIKGLSLWFGATTGKTHVAAGRAIFMVLVIPWLFMVVPCVGILMAACSPIWSVLIRNCTDVLLQYDLAGVMCDPGTDKYAKRWWRIIWDILPPQRNAPLDY